jgi:hypothetical protein
VLKQRRWVLELHRSEHQLQDGDVEPTAEFAADLPLHAHELETARPMQGS